MCKLAAVDIRASIVGLDNFSVECRDCEDVRSRSKRLRAGGIYLNSRSAYRSSRYYGSNSYYTSLRNRNYNTNRSTSRRNTSRNYYRSPIGRQTFSQGAKGITFFSTYLNSKSPFRVDGIFLSVAGGTQVSDKNNNRQSNDIEDLEETFSDFTLYVNGQREDSTDSFTRRNGQTGLLFNTTMDIPAGSQVLLTGRITNNGVTGDKIKFSLGRNGLIDPVYLYNGRNIDLGNINGGTTSNFSSTLNQPLSISK